MCVLPKPTEMVDKVTEERGEHKECGKNETVLLLKAE